MNTNETGKCVRCGNLIAKRYRLCVPCAKPNECQMCMRVRNDVGCFGIPGSGTCMECEPHEFNCFMCGAPRNGVEHHACRNAVRRDLALASDHEGKEQGRTYHQRLADAHEMICGTAGTCGCDDC